MSKYNTPDDTAAGSVHRSEDLKEKLIQALIQGSVRVVQLPVGLDGDVQMLALVEGGSIHSDVISYFNSPVLTRHNGQHYTFLDVRKYGKFDVKQSKFQIRNLPEYEWALLRASLSSLWVRGLSNNMRDFSALAGVAYATQIAETIARKYALDQGDQLRIMVMASFHYYCLYADDVFEEVEKNRVMGRIARELHVPATKVVEILDGIEAIDGAQALCEVIKTKLDTARLQEFNLGVLSALVAGNWAMFTDAREAMVVALEHIPTWLMIVYSSLEEATFKRTGVARILAPLAKAGAGEAFIKSMDRLMQTPQVLALMAAEDTSF